ncbi:PAS domain S-box protein, partial [Candidatus Pacearchaeota archaeon]|nr:PAS domain S-box protein [Candidatus Pacearchaeota archaeon]
PGVFKKTNVSKFVGIYKKALKGESTKNIFLDVVDKNGENHRICWSCFPVFDNNNFCYMIVIGDDVTKKQKVTNKLKVCDRKLSYLTENVADIIWTMDLDFNTTYVSSSIEKILGFTAEERKKQSLEDMVTHSSLKIIRNKMAKEMVKDKFKKSDLDGSVTLEVEYYKKDGSTIWLENKLKWIYDLDGKKTGILGVSRDISDRRESERKLRESEKKYRVLFNNALVGINIHNADGGIYSVNHTAEEIFGLSEDELKKKDLSFWKGKLINSDGSPMEFDNFPLSVVAKTKKPKEGKIVGLSMSEEDRVKWFVHSARPILDKNGDIDKVITSFIDVTELRDYEKKLEKNEEKFRRYFDYSPYGIFIADENGKWIDVNPQACKTTGFSKDELLQMNLLDLFSSDEKNEVKKAFEGLKKKGEYSVEIPFLKKDGSKNIWIVNAVKLSDNRLVGFTKDVTEEKKILKELKENELQYRTIFNSSHDVYLVFDLEGNIVDANKMALKTYGYSREELLKLSGKDIVHPDYHYIFKKFISDVEEKSEFFAESVDVRKDGSTFPIEVKGTGFVLKGKQHLLATIREISDRRKAEKELKESEKKYRTLFDTMAQGVVYQDADGGIISANPAAQRILGLSFDQMQGRTSMDPQWKAVDENKKELPGEKHPAMIALKTGKPVKDFVQGIFNPKIDDYVWILVSSIPQYKKGADKPYQVFSTFLDITEMKNANEKIKNLSKFPEENSNPVFRIDSNGKILYANDASNSLLDSWNTSVNNTVSDEWKDKIENVLDSGSSIEIETTCDKTIFSLNFVPISKNNYVNVYGRDITEMVKNSRDLKESEKKYRRMIELSPDGIATSNLKGIVTTVNKSFCDITGFNEDEIVGKHIAKLPTVDLKLFPHYINLYKNILQGKQKDSFEFRWRHKNGELRWGECRYSIMEKNGKKTGVQVILRDITERKKLNESFDNQRKSLLSIFDKIEQSIYVVDPKNYEILYANPFLEKSFDRKLVGETCYKVLQRKNKPCEFCTNDIIFKKKNEAYRWEYHNPITDRDYLITDKVIKWIDGRDVRFEFAYDITNYKKMSEKLRDSETLFRTLVEQSTVGVYIHDPVNNKVLYANPLIRKVLGFSKDESENVDFFKYLHPDDAKLVKDRIRRNLDGKYVNPSVEVRVIRPNGKLRWVRLYSSFIDYGGKKVALASAIDITENKLARDKEQEYLHRLER